MHTIKLFCFPYAGGSATFYGPWRKYLDPRIELVPVELAGRGKRIHERLYKGLPEVVEDAFHRIKDEIGRNPYMLFGHSMGGLICYELAKKIRASHLPGPLHMFFSGRSAPHIPREDEKLYHLMNEEDFKKEILQLGGTPPEVFQHPELLNLFLPVLKNDFKISETKSDADAITPFTCGLSAFFGKQEDLTLEQRDGWKDQTSGFCNIYYFPGGHFFIHERGEQIVRRINDTLHYISFP